MSAASESRPRRTSERCRERLAALGALLARGLTLRWSALGIGVHATTAWRWRRREARGQPLVRRRGPRPRILSFTACTEAAQLVRDLRGLIGAETLRHSVPGLTRRVAAAIKTDTCRAVERRAPRGPFRLAAPGAGSLVAEISPRAGGRPPMPERTRHLEEERAACVSRTSASIGRRRNVSSAWRAECFEAGRTGEHVASAATECRPRRTSVRCHERLAALCALLARGLTLRSSALLIGVHPPCLTLIADRTTRGPDVVDARGAASANPLRDCLAVRTSRATRTCAARPLV